MCWACAPDSLGQPLQDQPARKGTGDLAYRAPMMRRCRRRSNCCRADTLCVAEGVPHDGHSRSQGTKP